MDIMKTSGYIVTQVYKSGALGAGGRDAELPRDIRGPRVKFSLESLTFSSFCYHNSMLGRSKCIVLFLEKMESFVLRTANPAFLEGF